ncbi:MAG: hypothetical protein RQM92_03785 [Candidatus Syntrophopropionicum ammoniitolerans]
MNNLLWLEHFCRVMDTGKHGIEMTTPTTYLARYPDNQVVDLAASSWGEGGIMRFGSIRAMTGYIHSAPGGDNNGRSGRFISTG